MTYKECRCKNHIGERSLPTSEFTNGVRFADGLLPTSKTCVRQERISHKTKDIEHYRAKKKQSYYRHRKTRVEHANKAYSEHKHTNKIIVRSMHENAKSRAKIKGLEFNITPSDIIIPLTCPVLGTPIARSSGRATDNSPTLDRIDNTKGYTKGNIIVVSKRANMIKNCGSPDEHKRIYEYYSSLLHTVNSSE